MRSRLDLYDRALVLARLLAGGVMTLVGVLITARGQEGISGPTLRDAGLLPAWVWGAAACTAGVLALIGPTRRVGLILTAAWYLAWGALVAKGGITNPGSAWFPPVIYAQLAVTALLLYAVDRVERDRG